MAIIDYLGPSLDTTIAAIGNAIWLFATHPDQWQLLREQPDRVKQAFNEAMRLESPISGFTRVTTQPVELGGVEVPAGARVLVSFASANRDEQRWPDADQFDITRNSAGHVAFGYGEATGDPEDDYPSELFRRTPSVFYEVHTPNGLVFPNSNPSGNLEWEQFRIDTAPFDRDVMDFHADALPAGIYEIRLDGMDLSNLNAWRFFYSVLGVDSDGNPVPPLRPNPIGVWNDQDGDGQQIAGESGLPGITLRTRRPAAAVAGCRRRPSCQVVGFHADVEAACGSGSLPPLWPMCEALSSPSIMFMSCENSARPSSWAATGRYLARTASQSRLFIASS